MNVKIITILVMGTMLFTATAVFASKNYDSSKSNTTSIAQVNKQVGDILLRYYIGGAEINKVTDALAVGISDVDLKATLLEIGINEKGVIEIFATLDELGTGFIKLNDAEKAISASDAGVTTQAVEKIEIAVEKVERVEVSTSGAEDTPQPEVKAKAILLIKMEDKAISTPDDSFFDVHYELEVFVGVIAKDANITKADARKVVDALMAVSPAFTIDEDGLQDDEEARLIAVVIIGALKSELIAKRALDAFVGVTTKSLRGSDRVALVGFGSFSISKRKARTGATIQIPAKKVLEESKEEGESVVRKKPGRTTYSNIILERGYSEIVSMDLKIRENAKELREDFKERFEKMEVTGYCVKCKEKKARIIIAHTRGLMMTYRFSSAVARIDDILLRLESRVSKLETQGYEVDSFFDIYTSIEKAKNISVGNKAGLTELKETYEELLKGEDLQEVAKKARKIAKDLKANLKSLHTKLGDIVDEIKQARKDYNESKSTPIKL